MLNLSTFIICAIVCPTSANVLLIPRLTFFFNDLPYTNNGTYSLVWSVPLVVGSQPWSALIISISSSYILSITSVSLSSNCSNPIAYPS